MNDYYFEIWFKGNGAFATWNYSDFKIVRAENGLFAEKIAREYCKSLESEMIEYRPRNLRTVQASLPLSNC